MSTMGYLFFFSEANVHTIWYLFVAFACRNWEFFLLSSIWTIIFLQKQFIWYDVKNLKPQTHYKDLCCLCHWNLKAINAKWAIFDMKDYNYSLFLQINVTLRYLWSSVLLFSVERRRGENSCSVTRGTTQRSWSQTLWGKKKCLLIKESPSKYMYCISKKIFGVNFHIILEMSLWALANKTLD